MTSNWMSGAAGLGVGIALGQGLGGLTERMVRAWDIGPIRWAPPYSAPSATPPQRVEAVWPDVLTPAQAADYLQVQEDEVLYLLSDGTITGKQIHGEWRISRASIDTWLLSDD